ncbi:hypothetical protein H5410_044584 [Solanum commersonii]|uniref:Uncharacterized protein n=1 Tax=Solanum commersonii TaxID=4109 RepID=A0A9J5XA57_SOLCO|nr:hypothetical protein H5410_044584 [Solanum commersonii]
MYVSAHIWHSLLIVFWEEQNLCLLQAFVPYILVQNARLDPFFSSQIQAVISPRRPFAIDLYVSSWK